MSRAQKLNDDNSKASKDPSAEGLESTVLCVPIKRPTHSDGSIIKNLDQTGLKHKLVNKVKSWSSKDSRGPRNSEAMGSNKHPDRNIADLALDLENLNLLDNPSEDNLYKSDLLKAKDSLEMVRTDKSVRGGVASAAKASTSHKTRSGIDDDLEVNDVSSLDTITKVLTWDPWNKMARRNKEMKAHKKDLKKRKSEKSLPNLTETKAHPSSMKPKDDSPDNNIVDEMTNYRSYRSSKKAVDFVNEVFVVYFAGDEIITRGTEPLKKGLDQQIRNKEMRRGHVPCTLIGKVESDDDAWSRK